MVISPRSNCFFLTCGSFSHSLQSFSTISLQLFCVSLSTVAEEIGLFARKLYSTWKLLQVLELLELPSSMISLYLCCQVLPLGIFSFKAPQTSANTFDALNFIVLSIFSNLKKPHISARRLKLKINKMKNHKKLNLHPLVGLFLLG